MFATTFVDLYRIVYRENSLRSCISQYTHVTNLNRRSTFNKMIYQKWNFERGPNLTQTIYSSLLSLKLNKCNACAHLSGYPYENFTSEFFLQRLIGEPSKTDRGTPVLLLTSTLLLQDDFFKAY